MMACRLTIKAANKSLDAPSTIANWRLLSVASASPSAAPSSGRGSAASTLEVRSGRSDFFNAGSIVDVCLTVEASSSRLDSRLPNVSTAVTPGLSTPSAGIVADGVWVALEEQPQALVPLLALASPINAGRKSRRVHHLSAHQFRSVESVLWLCTPLRWSPCRRVRSLQVELEMVCWRRTKQKSKSRTMRRGTRFQV